MEALEKDVQMKTAGELTLVPKAPAVLRRARKLHAWVSWHDYDTGRCIMGQIPYVSLYYRLSPFQANTHIFHGALA